jgi:Bacterial archaeo-eukaryotic release factor family 7
MNSLTNADLKGLIDEHADWCVSLYMPTHRSLPEARQDPIRLKNLLREAERTMESGGVGAAELKELMQPTRALLDDLVFWQHQGEGLAVFFSANGFRHYRLPISFKELVVVSEYFHIKPLLPLLSGDDRFLILALSKNEVKLIEATRYEANEIKLENIPAGLSEILSDYDFEGQLQLHSGAQRGGAIFHGQGGGQDDVKAKLIEYFRRIDAGLREHLKDKKMPLVLAGVDSLFPIYREVNTYGNLIEEGIAGNPELLSAAELHQRGWEIVAPYFRKSREVEENRYCELAGTGRASNVLAEVTTAAQDGRIDVLFVPLGVQRWGRFDEDKRSVLVHNEGEAGDRDLLDVCATNTILNRGSVYAVEPEAVPGGGGLAAVFRY